MTPATPSRTSAPPAIAQPTPIAWLKENLFSTWYNGIITVVLLFLIGRTLISTLDWALHAARWAVIPENLKLYMTGLFPVEQLWRVWALLGMICGLAGLTWGVLARNVPRLFGPSVLFGAGAIALFTMWVPTSLPNRLLLLGFEILVLAGAWGGRRLSRTQPKLAQWLPAAWTVSFFVALWLLLGGIGIPYVGTSKWGGLLLTLFMAVISILAGFPLALVLALSRQSKLPVLKGMAVTIIELTRGSPLTMFLFIGDVMLPIILPSSWNLDRIFRAMVVLTLFCASYTAETIRGGLQAIPRGQSEAAQALGLNTPLTLGLVVLPQALKISIPALVGVFIQMVQETSLVAILGLFDLLGMSRSILSNPQFVGRYAEVYFFIGLIYWSFCYVMSLGSRRLEKTLNTGH